MQRAIDHACITIKTSRAGKPGWPPSLSRTYASTITGSDDGDGDSASCCVYCSAANTQIFRRDTGTASTNTTMRMSHGLLESYALIRA